MKLKITIATDNAAFEDNLGEIGRILHDLAERFHANAIPDPDEIWVLRDINGNDVGTATVTP